MEQFLSHLVQGHYVFIIMLFCGLTQQLSGTNCVGMHHSSLGWFKEQIVWVCINFLFWWFNISFIQLDVASHLFWVNKHYGTIIVLFGY